MRARILALFLLVTALPAYAGEMMEIMPESRTGDWDWMRRGLGIVSVTCYSVAAAALVVYLVWKLWPAEDCVPGSIPASPARSATWSRPTPAPSTIRS